MGSFAADLGVGVAAFTSTNVDDIFLLAAYFSDPQLRHRSIVVGQYLGIGALVLASVLTALLALALPTGWIALLGVVPLWLGFSKLRALRARATDGDAGNYEVRTVYQESGGRHGHRSQALAIAIVTVANGGDNLGVYVPLFAADLGRVVTFAVTFAVMTGVWCALGHWLVHNELLGAAIRRHAHAVFPFVLMSLGVYILSGALVLVR
jgi:cadmium resistance protein CadD (predicted permease)